MPFEYAVYKWRKVMRMSYREAMETPYNVMLKDFELMALEATYSKKQESK